MLLPGRAPQRFECVTAHVCVYFGKITMGGCVFTLHGKIILLTAWKINGMSLSLPASAVPRGGPHLPHGGALTQPPVSLTLAPVLTWLSPLFHLSFLHYYLSCPLVLLSFLSSVDRGSMSHHLPWHVAVFDSMRWSVLSVLLLAWILASLDLAALIPMTGSHSHIKKKNIWAHELVQGDFSNLNTERN